jgi:hypothetical protein
MDKRCYTCETIAKLAWSLFCHIFMKSHFHKNYCSSSQIMVDFYFIVIKVFFCFFVSLRKLLFFFMIYGRFLLHSDEGYFMFFFVSGWHFLLWIIGIVMAIMVNLSSRLLLMLLCRRIRMSCSQFYNHDMQFVLGFEAKLLLIIITTPIKIHLYVFENSFPLSLWSPNPPSSFEKKLKFYCSLGCHLVVATIQIFNYIFAIPMAPSSKSF